MRQLTGLLVREAMKQSRGNLVNAAKLLGISRQTALRYVMQEFSRM